MSQWIANIPPWLLILTTGATAVIAILGYRRIVAQNELPITVDYNTLPHGNDTMLFTVRIFNNRPFPVLITFIELRHPVWRWRVPKGLLIAGSHASGQLIQSPAEHASARIEIASNSEGHVSFMLLWSEKASRSQRIRLVLNIASNERKIRNIRIPITRTLTNPRPSAQKPNQK